MEALCKNCKQELFNEFRYCPECGQKVTIGRLAARDVVHQGVHYFTNVDKGILHLLVALAKKRGLVAREFIEGRRRKYFPPLNFFLLIATVFVFMATLNRPENNVDVVEARPELKSIPPSAAPDNALAMRAREYQVKNFTTQYSNLMAMFSLPITALIFWLFYRRSRYNYVEHLVAGMYMLGFCILIYALLILPAWYLFGFSYQYAVLLFFLVQIFYFTAFYYSFIGGNKKSIAKALGTSLTALIVWVVITSGLFAFYIANGFWGLFP